MQVRWVLGRRRVAQPTGDKLWPGLRSESTRVRSYESATRRFLGRTRRLVVEDTLVAHLKEHRPVLATSSTMTVDIHSTSRTAGIFSASVAAFA